MDLIHPIEDYGFDWKFVGYIVVDFDYKYFIVEIGTQNFVIFILYKGSIFRENPIMTVLINSLYHIYKKGRNILLVLSIFDKIDYSGTLLNCSMLFWKELSSPFCCIILIWVDFEMTKPVVQSHNNIEYIFPKKLFSFHYKLIYINN